MAIRKDLDDAKRRPCCSGEVDAVFVAAKKKVLLSFGRFVPRPSRDLPRCVKKLPSGRFQSEIRWGGKMRTIGTFDTPEQASAACLSVRKDRDDAKLSGSEAKSAVFDAAKKKALEAAIAAR